MLFVKVAILLPTLLKGLETTDVADHWVESSYGVQEAAGKENTLEEDSQQTRAGPAATSTPQAFHL